MDSPARTRVSSPASPSLPLGSLLVIAGVGAFSAPLFLAPSFVIAGLAVYIHARQPRLGYALGLLAALYFGLAFGFGLSNDLDRSAARGSASGSKHFAHG